MKRILNTLWKKTSVNTPSDVRFSQKLTEAAHTTPEILLEQMKTSLDGLNEDEINARQLQYGANEVAREKHQTLLMRLMDYIKNPLVLLLLGLAIISYLTGDLRATAVIMIMVILGVVLRYFQEKRADDAAQKLKEMVSITVTVQRDGKEKEVPLKALVPGDIIHLSVGDMVPADVRLLMNKDLFLNQSTLTGESMPGEKTAALAPEDVQNPLEFPNICFFGSNVESGSGTAVVVLTGGETYFGSLANSISGQRELTSFDRGINSFTWLMIGFMGIMVPIVFVLNWLSKGNWLEAFLFALAVAVGLTPEMLPMIVTVNLSKGAISMSKKKVIVKRLNAIQNFGAMDVLCTDKTGTLTQGKIILIKHMDVQGNESERILEFAFLNSYFQTGLKNLMDVAVLKYKNLQQELACEDCYRKIDEIPFDFNRRRMSVILEDSQNQHTLICKGAVEEVVRFCTHVEIEGQVLERQPQHDIHRSERVRKLNMDGFRVVALAYKIVSSESDEPNYSVKDESGMVLLGYLAFLDPPKETTQRALERLKQYYISVKILTGDNDVVTASIASQIGMPTDSILLGSTIEAMSEEQLSAAAENTVIFAKLSPAHKERIIRALQVKGHVVGFMGDGINDAPALKAADVGISVDSAADIAKESSDLILLEQSLLVLGDGVIEGRRVFGNIIKYVRMAASSNFGNMFSMVGASAFLPFIPMLPLQVLTNDLLYDFSQTTIPTDEVDPEWLTKPRKWAIEKLRHYILVIGPISSIFDYLTFFVMLYVFHTWNNAELFHTGWFIESIFTQTLIIHVIRTNKIPFIQSRASTPLIVTSIIVVMVAAWLTISPLAATLGLVPLPPLYWLILSGMLICYVVITQLVKTWFLRKYVE